MNRYAKVLTASALAYTAQASRAAAGTAEKCTKATSMSSSPQFIATAEQLVAMTKKPGARNLVVRGSLTQVPSFRLAPGQTLTGDGDGASISFVEGVDGLQLSSDNEVRSLRLETSADKRAIFNDTHVKGLGRIRLIRITTIGQVQLLARDSVRRGHVEVDGLDIIGADARAQSDRPYGFGAKAIQGAFTLWNMQTDANSAISAELKGLLVKGLVTALSAIGLSVKPGGSARVTEVDSGVTTNGPGIVPIELHGSIDLLRINGAAGASGAG
jgi:hypothetical protein